MKRLASGRAVDKTHRESGSALEGHPCGHRCLPSTPVAAVGGSFGVRLYGRAFSVEPGAAAVRNAVRSELTVEPDAVAAELLHKVLHNGWPGEEVHILRPSDRPEPDAPLPRPGRGREHDELRDVGVADVPRCHKSADQAPAAEPYPHAAKLQPHIGDIDLAVISQPAMPRIQLRAATCESCRLPGAHPATIRSKRPPVSNPMPEE
jgi:hypothetical protein